MLSPEYLKSLPDNIINIFEKLEEDILADVARRISKGMEITETADYQVNILQELGYTIGDVEEEIASTISNAAQQVDDDIIKSALISYQNEQSAYKVGGKVLEDITTNVPMMNFINAVRKQTKGEFSNLTNTLGFVDNGMNKGINKMYRDTLDYAVFQVSSGAFDYNTVLRQSVKKLSDSGVRSIDYQSGRSYHVDTAVRRSLMTGVSQITGEISIINADMLGQDLMEITAHIGARPDHADWQGQVVSRSGKRGYLTLDDIGYGTIEGFKGANCRHDWFAFFEGISKPAYTKEQLRKLDPTAFEYEGKIYNAYEASQKQRQVERAIKKTKRELIVYDNAGLKDDFTSASVKLRRQKDFYNDFSNKSGLRSKNEKSQVYGFDRSISQKSVQAFKRVLNDLS